MRHFFLWLAGLLALLLATGCGAGEAGSTRTVSRVGQASQDSQVAKLTFQVPAGWHAVRFSKAKGGVRAAGIQFSNVTLPAPRLLPGFPIQVNSEVLPPRGVGLIIATDTDHRLSRGEVAVPPLPLPWPDGSRGWLLGSSPARSPVFETLWFRLGRTTYVATAKIGWKATHAAQKALGQIVRSIKSAQAASFAVPSGSQHPGKGLGTVSGVAAHCAGPPQAALLPVWVAARSDGRTVASQVVRYRKDHDRYRLSLPQGRYVISARGSADPARAVVLHPGARIAINFPDRCS